MRYCGGFRRAVPGQGGAVFGVHVVLLLLCVFSYPSAAVERPSQQKASPAPEAQTGRILYYKSPMMPEETSPTPKKDSMGMDMVPVYGGEGPAAATPAPVQAAPAGSKESAPVPGAPRRILYYKSTMVAGEIRKEPGKDSMGMDMVPVYEGEEQGATITIDPVTQQNMGIRVAKVTRGPLRRVTRTVGMIDYNETTLTEVTTKFSGWIEKLYVDYTGQSVRAGDPLFVIYSPELYKTEFDYVIALRGAEKSPSAAGLSMPELTLQKLRLLDIPEEGIKALEKTRQAQRTLQINVPRSGIVVEKMVVQGMKVEAGQRLYRIADLSTVWLMAQFYEQDLPFLKLDQEATATIPAMPGRKFTGRVTYIFPWLDDKTRTAKVRLDFPNPELLLKPGMYADVHIVAELAPSVVLVPDMAVLRSGERNTVFVAKEGGRFDPREVKIGLRSEDNQYEVLEGLDEGETVVLSGQFMLDSESQLREAILKMIEPGAVKKASPGPDTPPEAAEQAPETEQAPAAPLETPPHDPGKAHRGVPKPTVNPGKDPGNA